MNTIHKHAPIVHKTIKTLETHDPSIQHEAQRELVNGVSTQVLWTRQVGEWFVLWRSPLDGVLIAVHPHLISLSPSIPGLLPFHPSCFHIHSSVSVVFRLCFISRALHVCFTCVPRTFDRFLRLTDSIHLTHLFYSTHHFHHFSH